MIEGGAKCGGRDASETDRLGGVELGNTGPACSIDERRVRRVGSKENDRGTNGVDVKLMTKTNTFNRDVARELRRAHDERVTGRLHALVGDTVREIFFSNGDIVGVRTSAEDERIGSLLVRFELITRQHLEDAYVFVRHGRRLGETLAELGILEHAEINPIVRQQVLEVGCSLVNAAEVDMSFHPTSDLLTTLKTPLAVADVIMEAARRIEIVDPLSAQMRTDRRLFQSCAATTAAQLRCLTPEDVYLISRFQGGARLDEVVRSVSMDSAKLTRTLLGLIESGMLYPEEPAADVEHHDAFVREVDRMYRLLERKDPWSALGLSRDVGIETARAAFRDAVGRYHPDRCQRVNDSEFQRQVSTVCSKFTDAYSCLTTALQMRGRNQQEKAIPLDSTARASSTFAGASEPGGAASPAPESSSEAGSSFRVATSPSGETAASTGNRAGSPRSAAAGGEGLSTVNDPQRSMEASAHRADVLLQEGKFALAAGDYWRAVQLLQQSIELNGEHAETHYRLGQAMMKNARWRHDAEKSFQRAIELEPWQMKYYEAMAHLYEMSGLGQRAERMHRMAKAVSMAADTEIRVREPMISG
jgi:tetratricopeptide (TPR) repeat protein